MFAGTCEYKQFANTNGNGGNRQNGITTQSTCQDRCNGNGLATGVTCYAYDFDVANKQCYIFASSSYTKNAEGSAPNVRHNVKDCTGQGILKFSLGEHSFYFYLIPFFVI